MRLGGESDVSITIGTPYDGKGVEQAKRDMESLSLKMRSEFEKASSPLDRVRQGINGVKSAWAEMLVAYGAVSWLASAAAESLQAEIGMRKLRTQIEHTGVSWAAVSAEVDAATQASARYGRVQQEEVVDSMRQLVWATGDYRKAMENLNLVQDLAYQTNMSTAEATRMVGLALTGNLEVLGRMKPEFRNLDEILGQHRTTADEVAYFYAVMREKVEGATQAMTEQEKMARDLNLFYKDLQQSIGGIVNEMNLWAFQMLTLKGFKEDYIGAAQAFQNIYNAFKYGAGAAEAMTGELHPLSQYIEETTKKTEKSSKEIAAESKARAEQAEKQKKTDELNKSLASSTADLRDQINKLNMDEQSYFEWKKGSLIQQGMSVKLVKEHTAALKELADAQKEVQKQQELDSLMKKMEEQAASSEKFKPATSIPLPDSATAMTAEEAIYARKLELAAGYYEAIEGYRDREVEQLLALMEVSGQEAAQTAFNENLKAQAISAAGNVAGQAYGMMINKLAQLAATGQFSAKALIAAMMDLTANTVIAIGQESAVRAVMEYAKGVAAAAELNPMAALHFSAAGMFTKLALGAAGVGLALKAGAMAMGGDSNREASPVYNANPYTGDPVAVQRKADQRPQIVFRVEKMELLDENSVDLLMARMKERVENYDVEFVASRTV